MQVRISGVLLGLMLTIAAPVYAAKPAGGGGGGPVAPIGYDISYPQCSASLPAPGNFAVVGLNGGKASNPNPCFQTEWMWALQSIGGTQQAKAGIYLNTANPADVWSDPLVAYWPSSGTNSYGICDITNEDSSACSYEYGKYYGAKDASDAHTAGAVLDNATWWLDVETANTWSSDTAKNRAALEGWVDGLKESAANVTVGLYSTSAQWSGIAGSVPVASNLYNLKEWRPGASSLKTAQSNCSLKPLTGGGKVIMTQYTSSGIDRDFSCIN
jgi:hypothetical protein